MCYSWPPRRRSRRLTVAIPASILVTEDTLELKTLKAGLVGRILAVHRVDEVALYRDPDTDARDVRLLKLILEYMVTPPHLKRRLHPLREELRAVGLLPPLRTCSHEVPEDLKPGVKLDVFIESCDGSLCRAYLGKAGYGFIRGSYRPGEVVTAVVKSVTENRIELEKSSWGNSYTGFRVRVRGDLEELVRSYRGRGYLVILSSKYGECIHEVVERLGGMIAESRGVLVVFGGPYRCPYEYTSHELYDAIVNTIPEQGTVSVRTEEAMVATLTAIDLAERLYIKNLKANAKRE